MHLFSHDVRDQKYLVHTQSFTILQITEWKESSNISAILARLLGKIINVCVYACVCVSSTPLGVIGIGRTEKAQTQHKEWESWSNCVVWHGEEHKVVVFSLNMLIIQIAWLPANLNERERDALLGNSTTVRWALKGKHRQTSHVLPEYWRCVKVLRNAYNCLSPLCFCRCLKRRRDPTAKKERGVESSPPP